jgi:hypothetical protein
MNRRLIKRVNILKYAVYLLIPIVYLYLSGMAFVNIPHVAQHIINEGAKQAISGNGHTSGHPYYLGLEKNPLKLELHIFGEARLSVRFQRLYNECFERCPLYNPLSISAVGFSRIKLTVDKEEGKCDGIFYIMDINRSRPFGTRGVFLYLRHTAR